MYSRYRHNGFTLVESLTALTVLSIAVAAIITPIIAAVEQKQRTAKQIVAVMLAEQLIEECLAQEIYSIEAPPDLGPSGGEPWRDVYNENSDYHDVVEGPGEFGTIYGPRLASAEFANLTRRMWLQYYYLPGQYLPYPPDILMLTVRVYDGAEELVTLKRFITNEEHTLP